MNVLLAFWRAILRFDAHEGGYVSGSFAFSGLLAVFPFLIFTIALTGGLIGQDGSVDALEALFEVAPKHIALTLEPVLKEVLSGTSGGFLTFHALAALWIASNAVEALRLGLDRAYHFGSERSFVLRRLIAFGTVISGALVAVGAGFVLIISPSILGMVESQIAWRFSEDYYFGRFLLAAIVFFCFLTALYRVLPAKPLPLSELWPGALATTLLWIVGAWAFVRYITFSQSYTVTYGTLAGVIITLLYFYLTCVTILIGAEFNAELADSNKED